MHNKVVQPERGRQNKEERAVQTRNGKGRFWGVRIRDWRLFTHGHE
jgi:hypothetical protein